MEIKTTNEIYDLAVQTKTSGSNEQLGVLRIKKWVAVDGLIHNIKMMKELWIEDNLNEDDFDNMIKKLNEPNS